MAAGANAIALPAANIYRNTFIKQIKKRTEVGGEFTYTSEQKDRQTIRGQNDKETEFLGWANPDNQHNNWDNAAMYDSARLEGSSFQREILHFIRVNDFNPWTVVQRLNPDQYIGKVDVYMMYAGGDGFALVNARLNI